MNFTISLKLVDDLGRFLGALSQIVLTLSNLFSFNAFCYCDYMPIKGFDLRHQVYNFQSVVWFFSQRVSEQIKLLQILKLRQLNQKFVKVSQFIISKKQNFQEFVLFQSIYVFDKVVLTVNFLAAEVGMNFIQILKLKIVR